MVWEETVNWRKGFRTLASALLFAIGTAFLLQSWALALMLLVVLTVHELGHIAVAWGLGIDWELGFGVAGAWTATQRRQRLALGHLENSLIHLAGPAFSLFCALLIVGLQLALSAAANRDDWLRAANLSALVSLLNLLPMGDWSDGGKFLKRLFSSLEEDIETSFMWVLVFWAASLLGIALVVQLDWLRASSILLIGIWFTVEFIIERTLDDPADAASPRAMTVRQGAILVATVVAALSASLEVVLLTPFWLTQGNIANMITRFASSLLYLATEGLAVLKLCLVLASVLLAYRVAKVFLFQRGPGGHESGG